MHTHNDQPHDSSHLEHRLRAAKPAFDTSRLPDGFDEDTLGLVDAPIPFWKPALRLATSALAPAGLAAGLVLAVGLWLIVSRGPAAVPQTADVNRDGVVNILDAHALAISGSPSLPDGTTPADIRERVVSLSPANQG